MYLFVFWCLVLCLFLLKLFALQNRLRKGWFPASWSVSLCFCVFNPESLWRRCAVAVHARPYQPSPLAPSLSANNAVIVCVPFVIRNHGKKLQRRKSNCVHSLSALLTSVASHWEIFCVRCNCPL